VSKIKINLRTDFYENVNYLSKIILQFDFQHNKIKVISRITLQIAFTALGSDFYNVCRGRPGDTRGLYHKTYYGRNLRFL
jgi:hypothetical protein